MQLFPEIEPYHVGYLVVGEGHTLYYEEVGNPDGAPVLYLHGGPGAGISPKHRRYFNPLFWRVILLDQRGAGKSRPFATLDQNTTWDLVNDLEKLRQHLGLSNWAVWGGSWGSTLALCYATLHRGYVDALMLRGIYLGRAREIHWLYQEGASRFFPEAYAEYQAPIPPEWRHQMLNAYQKILDGSDEIKKMAAAKAWSKWEASLLKLLPDQDLIEEFQDPGMALALARLECHYSVHANFLPHDNWILEQAHLLKGIPTRIIHGRYDMVCPPESAYALHHALPGSEYVLVESTGHSASDPELCAALVNMAWDFQKKIPLPPKRIK